MNLRPVPTKHQVPVDIKPSVPNPWKRYTKLSWHAGQMVETCDVVSRMEIIRGCEDVERLRSYIAWPGTQRTVRIAAERRLRKISKLKEAA